MDPSVALAMKSATQLNRDKHLRKRGRFHGINTSENVGDSLDFASFSAVPRPLRKDWTAPNLILFEKSVSRRRRGGAGLGGYRNPDGSIPSLPLFPVSPFVSAGALS